MKTDPFQNNQPSNNTTQIFKSDKALILNNINIIARSSDGYINATQMCQAGGRLFADYKRLSQTQAYLQALSMSMGIPIDLLLTTISTGLNDYRGTWVHRKVAYHLAQWISPIFAVQVSNWLDELFITGRVELGNELSNEELESKYQEKIAKMEEDFKLKLEEKDKEIRKITLNHEQFLKRQKRTVYEIGNVVYFVSNKAFTSYSNSNYIKVGEATQKSEEEDSAFMRRLSTYNTGSPFNFDVEGLFYIKQNKIIEQHVKDKFKQNMNPTNKEWIKDVPITVLKKFVKDLCNMLEYDYKEISCPEVNKIEEVFEEENEEVVVKETEELENESEEFEENCDEVEDSQSNDESDDETEEDLEEPEDIKKYRGIKSSIDNYSDVKLIELCKTYNLKYNGLKDYKKKRVEDFLNTKIQDYEKIQSSKKVKTITKEDVELYDKYSTYLSKLEKYTKEDLDKISVEFGIHKTSKHSKETKIENVKTVLLQKLQEYSGREEDIKLLIHSEKIKYQLNQNLTKVDMLKICESFCLPSSRSMYTINSIREKLNEYLKTHNILVDKNNSYFQECSKCFVIKELNHKNFFNEFLTKDRHSNPTKNGLGNICIHCLHNIKNKPPNEAERHRQFRIKKKVNQIISS
jgi:hypothetical protein